MIRSIKSIAATKRRDDATFIERPNVVVDDSKHEIGFRFVTCCEVIAEKPVKARCSHAGDVLIRLAD